MLVCHGDQSRTFWDILCAGGSGRLFARSNAHNVCAVKEKKKGKCAVVSCQVRSFYWCQNGKTFRTFLAPAGRFLLGVNGFQSLCGDREQTARSSSSCPLVAMAVEVFIELLGEFIKITSECFLLDTDVSQGFLGARV